MSHSATRVQLRPVCHTETSVSRSNSSEEFALRGAYITRTYEYDSIGNITAFAGVTYGYGQPSGIAPGAKPHAVTHVGGAQRYWYDANGNVITRTVGTATDSLTYDAENRLQSVTSGGETVTFTYDGDGRRVLWDTTNETTAYIGPHYELRFDKTNKPEDLDDDCVITVIDIMQVAAQWGQAGGPGDVNGDGTVDVADVQQVAGKWRETCHVLAETVKYYSLGGRRVAMRKDGTLYYLFTDHLGSTSVSYRFDGAQTTTQRYYPWGTIRPGPDNTLPTDHTFTGQKLDSSTGLQYYSDDTGYGRYYDPVLGRWTQPDSIVPNYGDPQSLNRYTYVNNRPTVLTDPDGHCGPVCAALYALWETFFGHGVSSAGGDLYDPETGEPCGDTGCVTPSKSQAEVAAGVALDVAVVETGGRAVNKVMQKGTGFLGKLLGKGETTGKFASESVRIVNEEIPKLSDDIARTFRQGEYTGRILENDVTVYRAEGRRMGRWFGTVRPDSAAQAERMYNVTVHSNDLLEVSTYRIPAGTVIYEGPVAGGTGWQIFIEDPAAAGVKLLETIFLPQGGF